MQKFPRNGRDLGNSSQNRTLGGRELLEIGWQKKRSWWAPPYQRRKSKVKRTDSRTKYSHFQQSVQRGVYPPRKIAPPPLAEFTPTEPQSCRTPLIRIRTSNRYPHTRDTVKQTRKTTTRKGYTRLLAPAKSLTLQFEGRPFFAGTVTLTICDNCLLFPQETYFHPRFFALARGKNMDS